MIAAFEQVVVRRIQVDVHQPAGRRGRQRRIDPLVPHPGGLAIGDEDLAAEGIGDRCRAVARAGTCGGRCNPGIIRGRVRVDHVARI
ncbi:hypothetical protein [Saccharopolyspora sp. NPDC050642]|uniref:hypothetical protein n=1 Tax=Saccharopolyspora sp. NPDC050642 TaxID=3157099 RepID=UPI00340B6F14